VKIRYFIIPLLLTCCLHAGYNVKSDGTFSYFDFGVTHSKITSIGLGCRDINNGHGADWHVSAEYPYKITGFKRFYPAEVGISYLRFFDNSNLYAGAGGKIRVEFNKNCFTPIELNPCLILGFLTKVRHTPAFIELKTNFLRCVHLISSNEFLVYSPEYKHKILKTYYFSVTFGKYF